MIRSVQAQKVPGNWNCQIWRQSANEGGKVVSHTQRPPLPPMIYSWCSFLLEEECNSVSWWGRKDYVNEKFRNHRGIEPVTFRLVAHWLQRQRNRSLPLSKKNIMITLEGPIATIRRITVYCRDCGRSWCLHSLTQTFTQTHTLTHTYTLTHSLTHSLNNDNATILLMRRRC